jgi:hypothetical protein
MNETVTVTPGMQAEMDIIFGDGIQHGDYWAGMRLDPNEPNKMVAKWEYVITHQGQVKYSVTHVHELVSWADNLVPIDQWQTAK